MASVFLYVPNIIGYIRLMCIIVCWIYFEDYRVVIPAYFIQAALDGVDGAIARYLDQCSAFGAWLDVLVDNIGRTVLWTQTCSWGVFIACFEWTVFVCTHTIGMKWKESFASAPFWVQKVMEKGFHTLIGGYVICGLHGLPLVLYIYLKSDSMSFLGNFRENILLIAVILLTPGRILCSAVESWCIFIHIKMLNQQLEETSSNKEKTNNNNNKEKTNNNNNKEKTSSIEKN